MDDYGDLDDFDDVKSTQHGADSDLSQIGKSTLKYLNYTKNYVKGWGLKEAFRETYQNWYVA